MCDDTEMAIRHQTTGWPPDRSVLAGSDDKWEGYCLGVDEAIQAALEFLSGRY